MPRYVYECAEHGEFEIEQRITDATLMHHPGCGLPIQRVIPKTSFKLNGSGWASDGYVASMTEDKGSGDG